MLGKVLCVALQTRCQDVDISGWTGSGGMMIQLGDHVRSIISSSSTVYIVVSLCMDRVQARVRTLPVHGNTYDKDGWHTLFEPVYTCDLDILRIVEE